MEFFEKIIGTIGNNDIVKIRKSSNETFVELKDGTIYQTVSATQSARGHKCNKAYIDSDVDKEIVYCVIKPMLVVSNLPENEQIEYF